MGLICVRVKVPAKSYTQIVGRLGRQDQKRRRTAFTEPLYVLDAVLGSYRHDLI